MSLQKIRGGACQGGYPLSVTFNSVLFATKSILRMQLHISAPSQYIMSYTDKCLGHTTVKYDIFKRDYILQAATVNPCLKLWWAKFWIWEAETSVKYWLLKETFTNLEEEGPSWCHNFTWTLKPKLSQNCTKFTMRPTSIIKICIHGQRIYICLREAKSAVHLIS